MTTTGRTVTVQFNNQQRELLERLQAEEFGKVDLPALVKHAIATAPAHNGDQTLTTPQSPPQRKTVAEHLIEPGKGKAIEVRKGQVLRIEQTEGGQCGDFNVYNLHDRQEHLHTGRTFIIHGRSPSVGDLLWSNGPHERPMMAILANTSRTDVLYAACSAVVYSRFFGARAHTNCQEIQAEAQREYGLSPHDVHPSFNLFMYVEGDGNGETKIVKNQATKDDYIEFVALMDVLAVPNVCGDDYGQSSNFWLRPLRAVVMEATPEDKARTVTISEEALQQVIPQSDAPTPIPLERKGDYEARYPYLPLSIESVTVELDAEEVTMFEGVRNRTLYGEDDGAAARDLVMSWVNTRVDW